MSEAGTTLEVAELADIIKLLPHRYPFLMIDRVIGMHADERAIGIKNVTINEPQFQGHFPGNPVFPGVLMIEGMAQTAGALCLRHIGASEDKRKLVYFMTIDKCKFRRPVVPGETIEYHMVKTTRRKQMWWFHGIAKVGDQVAAEADVGAMIAEAD